MVAVVQTIHHKALNVRTHILDSTRQKKVRIEMRNIAEILEDDRNGKQLSRTERQIALAYIQGKYDVVMGLKIGNNSNTNEVLNKIRAEIEEQKECRCFDDEDMYIYMTGLNDAIDIIDKYKTKPKDIEAQAAVEYYSGEYDGDPIPTGRVYILMHSSVTSTPHTFVKQNKTDEQWIDIDKFHENPDSCWAFSRQGAKKIIERYQTKTYKTNYDKGLVTFEMLDEYSY